MYMGWLFPSYPFLDTVLHVYEKWEEQIFSKELALCGIDARKMPEVWNFGMRAPKLSVLRFCAVCVFSFCLKGLHHSLTMSIESLKATVQDGSLIARLCY